jgi:hypothetical protein
LLDRALWMMLGMWMATFATLGAQYMIGDIFGWELTVQCTDSIPMDCDSIRGQPMKSYLVGYIDLANINGILSDSIAGTDGGTIDRIVNSVQAAAYVGWNIIALMTGTYIFSFLYFMGVPTIFVVGIALVYAVLLIRAIVGYIRGV